jgi:hypothetical protein
VSRLLVIFGILLIVLGVAWPILKDFGLGRLPGDILIKRDGLTLYVPLATSFLVSLVLSFVLWLLGR